jgi:hypothetical protein
MAAQLAASQEGLSSVSKQELLLCNDHEISKYTKAVSRQRIGEQVPVATNMRAKMEVLLETVFL